VGQDPSRVAEYVHSVLTRHTHLVTHHDIAVILTLIHHIFRKHASVSSRPVAQDLPSSTPRQKKRRLSDLEDAESRSRAIFNHAVDSLAILVRQRPDNVISLFLHFTQCLGATFHLLKTADNVKHVSDLPAWLEGETLNASAAKVVARLLVALTSKSFSHAGHKAASFHGALSKHAPFLLVRYLLACTSSPPLAQSVRAALWPGIKAVMSTMSKFEREALMKGMLTAEHEAERMLLRQLCKDFDRQRYKGS
jgi:hypothetical protein